MKLLKFSSPSRTIAALFIIGLIVGHHQVNCLFAMLSSISAVIQVGYGIYGVLNDAHDTYNKFATASTQDVMDKMVSLAADLDRIGTRLEKKIDHALQTLLRRIPLANKIDENVQELNQYIVRIDSLYNDFEEYIKNPDDFDSIEVSAIVEAAVSRDPGDVRDVTDKMHSLIVPGRLGSLKQSLLLLLSAETQEFLFDLCDTGSPPQQRIFELYSMVMITELRSYTLTGFSYLQKSMDEDKNFMRSLDRLAEKFELRAKQYLLATKDAMTIASRQFRRCDPSDGYVRGESFFEFERFIQTFGLQETGISAGYVCSLTCSQYPFPSRVYTGCYGFECGGTPSTCYGGLLNCESLSGSATFCENEPSNPRRYQYVVDGYGDYYGDFAGPCEGTKYYASSWNHALINLCDICRCTCVEDVYKSKSSHFISLRSQESDIENNKVVTGVRFRQENRVLHIQIEEGLLGINATISEESAQWKEFEDIEYDEGASIEADEYSFTMKNADGITEKAIVGEDVGVLSRDNRKFYLDALTSPDNHAVTGVKFAQVPYEENTATPIYLMIRYTEFDYYTGELKNINDSPWISYKDTPYGQNGEYRQDLDNEVLRNPLKRRDSIVNSQPNQVVIVEPSNWWDDVGQTVLPLLDGLPIYANPLTPLSGLGLYHKAPNSAGGFLTLVAEGINKALYIEVE